MGPDVAAEVDQMYRLDVDAMPEWTPLFDPAKFQQDNPSLLIKDWALAEDAMLEKAKLTSSIRA